MIGQKEKLDSMNSWCLEYVVMPEANLAYIVLGHAAFSKKPEWYLADPVYFLVWRFALFKAARPGRGL